MTEGNGMARRTPTHVDSAEGVARRLRSAREAAGLSQTALSFPGCSTGYVSRIEAGQRVPSLQILRELATRLGVSESWLARGGDEKTGVKEALRDAELALRLDHLDEAEALYEQLAPVATTSEEQARIAVGFGQLAFRRDDLATAIEQLERALTVEPDLWDQGAIDTLGRAYFRSGETEVAIGLFRRALTRAERENDPAARLRFAVLLTYALTDVGEFAEATAILSRIIAEVDGGDPLQLARVYWAQARLHTQQHDHDAATRYARKALQLLDATEHTYFRSRAFLLLAFAELDSGSAEEALGHLETGLALLGDQGTPHDRAQFHLETARALAMLGRVEEAAALAMQAASEFRSGHPANLGRTYACLAEAFEQQDQPERAVELYELALELLEEPPSRYLADTYARYGALLEALGRTEEAFVAYKKGATLRAQLERSSAL
jgi:tetratricopeptide (TPR) repeat protein